MCLVLRINSYLFQDGGATESLKPIATDYLSTHSTDTRPREYVKPWELARRGEDSVRSAP